MRRYVDTDGNGAHDSSEEVLVTEHHNVNEINEIESRVSYPSPTGGGQGGGDSSTNGFAYDGAGNLVFDGRHYFIYDAWNRVIEVHTPGTLAVVNGVLQGDHVEASSACWMHDFGGDGDVDGWDWSAYLFCEHGEGEAPPDACRRGFGYHHDADGDGDVDQDDQDAFAACLDQCTPQCVRDFDWDAFGVSNGVVDLDDLLGLEQCLGNPPPAACARTGMAFALPASGTFAMHGRPVEVLSDGHVLADFRARLYHPKLGRFLTHDPKGYVDGGNLYEAFGGNPLSNTDPMGMDSVTDLGDALLYSTGKGDAVFSWHFARVIDDDNVLLDSPNWPFAFVIANEAAIAQFDTGPFTNDFFSVADIMSQATKLAIDEGARFPVRPQERQVVRFVLDKTSSDPRFVPAADFYGGLYRGAESANLGMEVSQAVLLRRVQAMAQVTAATFTVTTGLLTLPAGAGAAAVDVGDTVLETASGNGSALGTGVALTAVAGGVLLHLHFADDAARAGGAVPSGAKGLYGEVGGHHVHSKAAFRGDINYDPMKGFSISDSYMQARGWQHKKMTGAQQRLFRELAASNRANSLREHSRIAVEALVAGGATRGEARALVAESLRDLRARGVRAPTDIPWDP